MTNRVLPLVVQMDVEGENSNSYNLSVNSLLKEYSLSTNEITEVQTNDYNQLLHLPVLNGLTFIGDKSLEYYGIQRLLSALNGIVIDYENGTIAIADDLILDCGTSTIQV